ncbi:unnamed protein product [Rotaria sordida]|uniref:receptor protein serine/threonine kinase n=1 Tax=Rotaria sordida TaxID=392033 RepID=A0A819MGV0_9BILA|nr:unnamed protein product [Rotaria sordida]
MIKNIFILTILICLTVISQENHDDSVSFLIDGTRQRTNITCLCTEDENCDSNTRTCRLTHVDHACYESWTKESNDDMIHVTAGCVYNEFLFTQIFCDGNQSNRYIICCSDKNYCNDRDAYSSDIRKKLLLPLNKYKSNKFLIRLILIIIIISSILLFCSLFVFSLYYNKRKKRNSSNCDRTIESNKKSGLCIPFLTRSKHSTTSVKSDQCPDDISRSSEECNTLVLEITSFAKQVILEKQIGIGAYGIVYRGKWYQDTIAIKICFSSEEPSWRREVYVYREFRLNHENVLRYIAADRISTKNLTLSIDRLNN